VSHLGRGIIYFSRFSQWQKNFKLHLAHRFDSVKQMKNLFLKLLLHSINSDACSAKKTDRKFRREVTTKRCAKFENAPWYQMDGNVDE
jgi:hypothetical protein